MWRLHSTLVDERETWVNERSWDTLRGSGVFAVTLRRGGFLLHPE